MARFSTRFVVPRDGRFILIVGYGNTLRRDDGIGAFVAEAIAAENWPGVRVRKVHQLTPELAEEIAACQAVIFVDASVAAGIQITRLEPLDSTLPTTHICDPRGLLQLAAMAYGSVPVAWLVAAAGEDFSLGEGLSQAGQANFLQAVESVRGIVRNYASLPASRD